MIITTQDIKAIIGKLCSVVIKYEVYFCELDSVAGDGDFGMSLAKGFREIQKNIDTLDASTPYSFIRACSMIISEYCGGASGPIWGSAFGAAAKAVKGKEELQDADIPPMFIDAVAAIQKRGGAKLGDKTLLDALIPATKAISQAVENGEDLKTAFEKAAKAAGQGAESTREMVAKKGRATYVGERSLSHPDAGAMAIEIILSSLIL